MRTATLTQAQSGQSAYSLTTFVLRQGEPTPSGNVYADWATLYIDLLTVQGLKTVVFDSSLAPCQIDTAGTYMLKDVIFHVAPDTATSQVIVADGVKLQMLNYLDGVELVSQSLSSILDVFGAQSFMTLTLGAAIRSDPGAAPAIFVDNGLEFDIVLLTGGTLGDGTNIAVQVDGTGQFSSYLSDVSNISGNAFAGTGNVAFAIISPSAQIDINQPGLTTPPTIFNLCSAALLSYIYLLADIPLWNSTPQITEVASAITSLNHRADFFIFQPGGANGGPFYTNWLDIGNAIVALQGPRKITILIDDTFGPAQIPAGGWSSNSCEIEIKGMPSAAAAGTPTQLTLLDSVVFVTTDMVFTDIGIIANNTLNPVVDASLIPRRVQLRGCTTLTTTGTSPFFLTGAGVAFRLELNDFSHLVLGTAPIISTPIGGIVQVHASGESLVDNNTLDIDLGATQLFVQVGGAIINPSQIQGPFPITTGGTFIQQFTNSDLVAGHLTGNHDLGVQWVSMTVYDNGNDKIIPDNENVSAPTNYDIDLTSFGAIAGTWTLMVKR